MRSFAALAAAVGLSMLSGPMSKAAELAFDPLNAAAALPLQPVVVYGAETRQTLDAYARKNHLDAADLKRRHAASGIIHCGNARGAGQLTLADDVITTAAHVFYNESGELRGDEDHCAFEAIVGDHTVFTPIDVKSIVAGSTTPYAEVASNDWAVAHLRRPVADAAPYALGEASAQEAIRFVARGHSDWGGGHEMSMENCRLRDKLRDGAEGTREFAFDCAAGVGASGSGLLDADGGRLLAVFVGFRTVALDQKLAYSPFNYNFAVTVDGEFRRAVTEAASLKVSQAP